MMNILASILLIVSAIVAAGIGGGAAFLWKSNGPLMTSIAKMVGSVALEILIAMAAEVYLASQLPIQLASIILVHSAIKLPGRLLELWGVVQFLMMLRATKVVPSA